MKACFYAMEKSQFTSFNGKVQGYVISWEGIA
jgi:hypothetical protein